MTSTSVFTSYRNIIYSISKFRTNQTRQISHSAKCKSPGTKTTESKHKPVSTVIMAQSSTGDEQDTKPTVSFLPRGEGRAVAYNVLSGNNPGIVFLPGFQSHMDGTKAKALYEYCKQRNLAYTRFDYQACGQSTGDMKDITVDTWKADILAVLDEVTAGPQLLVGSSMGGWLMLMVAMERKHRLHSLVGIATAAHFPRKVTMFTEKQKLELEKDGYTHIQSEYGSVLLTREFCDSMIKNDILHKDRFEINTPVRLLHGMKDDIVPYQVSLEIAEKVFCRDVDIVLRKNGDHRLSQPDDLQLLFRTLDELIAKRDLYNVVGLYSQI